MYFIFFTFFVPFTQCNIEHDFSIIDDVSDYEIVPIRHKRGSVILTIQTIIMAKEQIFYLQPTEGLIAGTKTNVFTASSSAQNIVNFKFLPNVMNNVFLKFYQDPKTSSSIVHTINKLGKSEFNGIINNNMVIRPMFGHFRERRDLLKKNFSLFENDDEGFINTDEHIIYRQTFNNASKLFTPKVFDDNKIMKFKSISRRSLAEISNVVYPEIMIFIDDLLFKKFNYDVIKAIEYTLSFWNGVDLRYREFENPKIRLYVTGIVLLNDPLSFVNNAFSNISEEMVYSEIMLHEFSKFLHEIKFIPPKKNYDISLLMTGRELLLKDYENRRTAGMAFTAGVCRHEDDKYYSSGIVEDNNGFQGIIAAAHELAHIFGAPHDEEDLDFVKNGTKHCLKEEGYIMGDISYNKNRILFSSCSKEVIGIVLSEDFTKCIRNNPAEYKNNEPLARILPGEIMSLDEQCQNLGYTKCYTEKTTCLELYCIHKNMAWWVRKIPPAEGSSCGDGKYCLSGQCVDII
ncbi:venom metalloproteinase antarease-like TtrivMP_A [Leptopilina boulardi]|uniref:venom metalloproteinase antarease-like TtrivMP_A n=1 Tax=Leptopilina boulardi TaxID=63433 RepID=UPI0021F5B6DD|nr:venom metalloproteinase antarease-like TtrivMP_A [Leptopilina boulardi]